MLAQRVFEIVLSVNDRDVTQMMIEFPIGRWPTAN